MKVQRSVDINAPPEKTWSFMSMPENILKWYFPLRKFEYFGEKKYEVGAPFRFEEEVSGRLISLDCEITHWEEDKAFAFKMTSGDMKSYEEQWTVEQTPSGSRFTFAEQGELPYSILGRLIDPIASRSSAATVEKMLKKLKSLAENDR